MTLADICLAGMPKESCRKLNSRQRLQISSPKFHRKKIIGRSREAGLEICRWGIVCLAVHLSVLEARQCLEQVNA